jgi:putative transposase
MLSSSKGKDLFEFDTKIKEVRVLEMPDSKGKRKKRKEKLLCLSSQMKQQIKMGACDSIKAMSAGKKKGRKVGKLRFRGETKSIPLANQTIKLSEDRRKVRIQGNKKWHRLRGFDQLPLPDEGLDIRKADLVFRASGVYLHLTVKVEVQEEEKKDLSRRLIGVDFGIGDTLTFSDGSKVSYVPNQKLLDRAKSQQRELSRKKKGSRNNWKARQLLRRTYEKIDNQKKDCVNKLLNAIQAKGGYTVCYQDEALAQWQKGGYGKTVQTSILGKVKSALSRNPDAPKIDRFSPTTKTCYQCGCLNKLKKTERTYRCACGYECERDTHAARNILRLGVQALGLEDKLGSEQAFVEPVLDYEPTICDLVADIGSKRLAVKQEAHGFSRG